MDWIEFVVQELYERARLDMREPWGAVRIAAEILGSHGVHLVPPGTIPGRAALAWSRQGAAMHIRVGLTPQQVNHAVARELAEWSLRLCGYVGDEVEALAGGITAALCVPRPAFERARKHFGKDIKALSHCFAVSQSLMALRIGECDGPATALRTAARVRIRGARYDWPKTPAEWDTLISRAAQTGLVVHRIDDAPGRIALIEKQQ